MPFIVQCPHADCRRFMLLEDEVRGTTANCLLCSKPIKVDAPGSGSHNSPGGKQPTPAPSKQPTPPPTQAPREHTPPPGQSDQKIIVTCPNPKCRSPLKVAPSSKGTNLRCPKCKQVFKA